MKRPISDLRLEISAALSSDLTAIAEHYAFETQQGVATFDTVPPAKSYWEKKLSESQDGPYPFFAARSRINHQETRVCGWGSMSRFDDKEAYKRTAEFSVYVLNEYQGHGIGRALMIHALELLEQHPVIQTLISRIVPSQKASIHLHEAMGFKMVGLLKKVGDKHGLLHDVAYYQFDQDPTHRASLPNPE